MSTELLELPRRIFVYGTLRTDLDNPHRRSQIMEPMESTPAFMPGRLYNLGAFPGAKYRPDNEGDLVVIGQMFDASGMADEDFVRLIRRLDGIEGHPHMFRRIEVELQDPMFETWRAITYQYEGRVNEDNIILSGNWEDVA